MLPYKKMLFTFRNLPLSTLHKTVLPNDVVVFTVNIYWKDPHLIPTYIGLRFELVGMFGDAPRRNKTPGLSAVTTPNNTVDHLIIPVIVVIPYINHQIEVEFQWSFCYFENLFFQTKVSVYTGKKFIKVDEIFFLSQ